MVKCVHIPPPHHLSINGRITFQPNNRGDIEAEMKQLGRQWIFGRPWGQKHLVEECLPVSSPVIVI